MKQMCIGLNKASLVDDSGVVFTAVRKGNRWLFEGNEYDSPFDAFKKGDRDVRNQ